MKLLSIKNLAFLGCASLAFTSCIKDDVTTLKDQGATFVKILEADANALFFEPFTDVRAVNLFSLRKDANSSASLNSPTKAVVKLVPTLIPAGYEPLPDSLYTLAPGITKSGSTYDMSFAPGEFAKEFKIMLNGKKWDLAHKYALGFSIQEAGGAKISADKYEVVTTISIKNKYDGVYEVNGTMVDVISAANVPSHPHEWELQTLSADENVVFDPHLNGGLVGISFSAGGSGSYFGSFGLILKWDLATDKIASVRNYYGQPASNTRSAILDPSGQNYYDAATKTIYIKYIMVQPSSVPAPPSYRVFFNDVWKYTGPRG